jgi:ribokinase
MPPLRCAVVGGLNMDLVVRLPSLPRPGETLVGEDLLRAAGGKGANQAVGAARLGAEVAMVGRVGRDAFGDELTRQLGEAGVSTRWLEGCDRPTGAALIFVDESGENCIAVAPGANQELRPEGLPREAIQSAEVLMAPLEVPMATIEAAFRLARAAARHTVLNAAPAGTVPPALLDLSSVVICNEVELGSLIGGPVTSGDEAIAARGLLRRPDQVVVVTLGARGAVAIFGDEVISQPAFAVNVVDTTGAGDAFVAGFVVAQWFSAGVAEALRWGCAAGSLATTRPGAQPSMPTHAEVSVLLRD